MVIGTNGGQRFEEALPWRPADRHSRETGYVQRGKAGLVGVHADRKWGLGASNKRGSLVLYVKGIIKV